ncbi:MAG TPA: UDP-N-acetylglucosamine--N-acetylmuramyl-(pentapeptide) pyrophosphoryl-undecaprenol N-acetylglucosamine transferase, partial [Elusimicrobiales bacterium]|nr:UDP-N-acetylglucosamine--N-acetylmuramyl-(pentapeptide) pyrophosphoryl-undecaprenol N-acetylglucosamine transferase [Elusimicrobiales bacterium]
SFPVSFCGWCHKIPVLVHEANAKMGLSNKIASYFANKVALGLPIENLKLSKYILTGTPIRKEFGDVMGKRQARALLDLPLDKSLIVIFGGSQGAKKINEVFVEIAKKQDNCHFFHITGKRDYEYIKTLYGKIPENVTLADYCSQMHLALKAADIVVSRSGASIIAELITVKTPAILVPFPHATARHQYFNAKVLEKYGAVKIIRDTRSFQSDFSDIISQIFADKSSLAKMADAYKNVPIPNPVGATDKLLEIIQMLV